MKRRYNDPALRQVAQQVVLGGLVIILMFMLFGCSRIARDGKQAMDIRAGLDECHENKLSVVLFQRPDHVVYAIRCFPPAEEVDKTVMVRPKTPINLLRPFMETINETVIIQQKP